MQVENDIAEGIIQAPRGGLDEFYYNINLAESVSGEELSSITETIFEGLQESKEIISEHIEAEVDNLETLVYDVEVDPDAWKLMEEEEPIRNEYLERYRVKIRLEDLPSQELDYELLKRHVMEVYQSLLQNESKKMVELDVISIDGGGGNIYKQGDDTSSSTSTRMVVFRVDVVAMLDVEKGRAALTEVLSNEGFKNKILIEMQSYTDSLSLSTHLDWCTIDETEDGVHVYSATCPSQLRSASSSSWKLSLWAAITLAAASILLCCCLWFVAVMRIGPKRQKQRQQQNMKKDVTGLMY